MFSLEKEWEGLPSTCGLQCKDSAGRHFRQGMLGAGKKHLGSVWKETWHWVLQEADVIGSTHREFLTKGSDLFRGCCQGRLMLQGRCSKWPLTPQLCFHKARGHALAGRGSRRWGAGRRGGKQNPAALLDSALGAEAWVNGHLWLAPSWWLIWCARVRAGPGGTVSCSP